MANQSTPSTDPTRRTFLAGVCGAVVAMGAGAVLLADDATAATGITRRKDGRVVVQVSKVPGLKSIGGTVLLGTVKGVPVAVVRTGRDSYEALNLQCTHLGTTVVRNGSGWVCPSHGSRFAVDGDVERGPAPTDLLQMPSRYRRAKKVLVVG